MGRYVSAHLFIFTMKKSLYSLISLIESLILITISSATLFLVIAYSDYRTMYPIYNNINCVVAETGTYNEKFAPKTFIVIKLLDDSTKTATLNSANIDGFTDFKYKVGDTLHYKYLLKKRFIH